MQAIFDHLTAVILGAGVILLLGSAWFVASKSSTNAALGYQSRTLSGTTISIFERDFRNIGSGVPTDEQAIIQMQTSGTNHVLEFKSTIDPSENPTPTWIRYTVDQLQANQCLDEPPCYSLTRMENHGSWEVSGPENVRLSRFFLQTFPTGAVNDDIQYIEVSMAFDAQQTPQREFSWENTFYLTALDIRRNLD